MKEKTIDQIKKNKIIAIVRGIALEDIIPMAEALYKGGIKLLEVTFNQSSSAGEQDTESAIERLCDHFGQGMTIGAGTVINEQQAEVAIRAGAKYIISPNTDLSVIKRTNDLDAVSIPGALSPSEVANAYLAGAHIVKLFPADNLGISYIKAIRAPLSHIPLLAVGGVNDKNLLDFFKAGVLGVGIGSNIVNKDLVIQRRFADLTALAKKYTSQI